MAAVVTNVVILKQMSCPAFWHFLRRWYFSDRASWIDYTV